MENTGRPERCEVAFHGTGCGDLQILGILGVYYHRYMVHGVSEKNLTFTVSSGISQQMKTTFCQSVFFLKHPVLQIKLILDKLEI